MANLYKYTKDGTRVATYASNRNGDIEYLFGPYFLMSVTAQGIYLYSIESGTFTQKYKVIDYSTGAYNTNKAQGVTYDGKYICVLSETTSIPAQLYIDRFDWGANRVQRYRLSDDAIRGGLTWDGKYFYTWDRDASPDELDKILCLNGTGQVVSTVSSSFNAHTTATWDGRSLFVTLNAASAGRPIAQINLKGDILQAWAHGVTNMQGICTDGKYIYVLSN